ncbi:MAG: stage III sporulation protein AB [Clostridia bacterium]|nr:stage III sporulation protein AB [Clostridia bacterium]
MLKFLTGVAIVIFTTFCGRLLSKKYRTRKQFFTQMQEFNQRFLTEISYYRRPLEEFCARFSYRGEFQELLEGFFKLQKQGDVFKNAAALDLSSYGFLSEEERAFVGDYFLTIGRGDSASQKAYFSSSAGVLAEYKTKSEEESKKYGDLYTKLGFLAGLAVLIILV